MIEEEDKGLEVYADWVGGIVRSKTGALSTKSKNTFLLTRTRSKALIIISLEQVNHLLISLPSSQHSSNRSLSSSLNINPSSRSITVPERCYRSLHHSWSKLIDWDYESSRIGRKRGEYEVEYSRSLSIDSKGLQA